MVPSYCAPIERLVKLFPSITMVALPGGTLCPSISKAIICHVPCSFSGSDFMGLACLRIDSYWRKSGGLSTGLCGRFCIRPLPHGYNEGSPHAKTHLPRFGDFRRDFTA